MRINSIEKQKLERQYGVWEIKGSNPFTDPGYEVKCEEVEYVIPLSNWAVDKKSVFLYYLFLRITCTACNDQSKSHESECIFRPIDKMNLSLQSYPIRRSIKDIEG